MLTSQKHSKGQIRATLIWYAGKGLATECRDLPTELIMRPAVVDSVETDIDRNCLLGWFNAVMAACKVNQLTVRRQW